VVHHDETDRDEKVQQQEQLQGQHHYLGTFDTKHEAALAYDKEARQRGEDRPLNYESIAAAEEASAQAQAEHIVVHPPQPKPQPKPRPASGFNGVYASGKRWSAQISYNSKNHNLGTFDTKHEAALVYDKEARQRGEDRPLNFDTRDEAGETRDPQHDCQSSTRGPQL
jgi:hypothetical protein